MSDIERNHAREEYRLFLLPTRSNRLLAYREGSRWRLPRISIPRRTRPAEQLQQAVQDNFGLHIIVLDLPTMDLSGSHCVVAEVHSSSVPDHLMAVPWKWIAEEDLLEWEKEALRCISAGKRGPLSQPGWMEEAIAWVQSAIPSAAVQLDGIRQYNASGGFALVRLPMRDGRVYWLKATGVPNRHEFDVTGLLAEIYPVALPTLVASRRDWNAWLMEDAGRPIVGQARLPMLERAVTALASLQQACLTRRSRLLAAGAFDIGMRGLQRCLPELIEYLSLAMEHQASNGVPRLTAERLVEIGQLLKNACDCMEELAIPDTLVHNDMNPGSVLYDGTRCVLTDWCEAGVGNPFLTFQHLSLLTASEAERTRLREVYRGSWLERLSTRQIRQAFHLAPLLAIVSYLYGRGNWLVSPSRTDPYFESYARSLARHIDRAARVAELQEVLCA